MSPVAPWIPLVVPLVGAALIPLAGEKRPNLREAITLLTSLALLFCVGTLVDPVLAGERPRWEGPEVAPGLSFVLEIEPLGLLYAGIGAALWLPNSIYSIGYMRSHHERRQTRFYACFALALSSVMGIAFAGNLFTLFVFYEVLTLSTFPLVTHHGSAGARRSGRIYLGFLLTTSMLLLLLAIVWTWTLAGRMDFVPGGILAAIPADQLSGLGRSALLALFVFGIGKAAVMPVHFWLPQAMVAPTPVSALLHAVAVVKAGVFSVLKVSVYVFGVDQIATSGDLMVWVAAGTILAGSLAAMTCDNLKARLAYSTISQLSYIVLGACLGSAWGIVGGVTHVAMHAFGKITLFFCAGAIYVTSGKTRVSELDGMGRRMPITFFAFFLGALSIIGLPPLGGAWSKYYLGLATLDAGHPGLLLVLCLSSLMNLAYLLPIPIRAFFLPAPGGGDVDGDGVPDGIEEAPLPCLIALSATAIGSLALFFSPDLLLRIGRLLVEVPA